MKKKRFLLIAAALAAAALSSACSLIYDSESSDISSDSDDMSINSYQSTSDSSDISSDLTDSSQDESDSSETSVEKIPVAFSEEDREVQKILSDMMKPADEVYSWIIPDFRNPSYEFWFSDFEKSFPSTYYLFSGSGTSEDHLFERPDTYLKWKELMLEYFSAEKTEASLPRLYICTAVENADGTYTLKSADESPLEFAPMLFEADGKLYLIDIVGNTHISIDLDTVKVSSKTDDTIEFTYIHDNYYRPFDTSTYLSDITFYSECASNGTLKYERGGWKLDSWW